MADPTKPTPEPVTPPVLSVGKKKKEPLYTVLNTIKRPVMLGNSYLFPSQTRDVSRETIRQTAIKNPKLFDYVQVSNASGTVIKLTFDPATKTLGLEK